MRIKLMFSYRVRKFFFGCEILEGLFVGRGGVNIFSF